MTAVGRPPRARAAASLLALALLATGCAADGGSRASAVRVRTQVVDGQAAQAVLPPAGTATRGLVVFLHGLHQSAASTTTDPDVARVASALARAGFVVVSSDADGDSFGSPAGRAAYLALARTAADRYRTSATLLLAESMGGLSAIPLVASGQVPDLVGTIGISPAISLAAPSGRIFLAAAQKAWGRDLTSADDPLAIPPDEFAGQRFRFYVTPGDTAVPTAEHASVFARRVAGVASVQLVACTGEHVDGSCFRPADVVRWARSRAAAATSTSAASSEAPSSAPGRSGEPSGSPRAVG